MADDNRKWAKKHPGSKDFLRSSFCSPEILSPGSGDLNAEERAEMEALENPTNPPGGAREQNSGSPGGEDDKPPQGCCTIL